MQINFSPELEPFVEQEFATGQYATREEILVQALRWMSEERKATVVGIQEGLDDVAAGRTRSVQDAFADIRKEFGITESK